MAIVVAVWILSGGNGSLPSTRFFLQKNQTEYTQRESNPRIYIGSVAFYH